LPPERRSTADIPEWARRLLETARVGRLATVREDGWPHVVPICFVLAEPELYTAVDAKPKRHQRLVRIANLERRPKATLLVDLYREDWRRLAWVRIDADAAILEDGSEYREALALLTQKYRQYRRMDLERTAGPVIRLHPRTIACWRAAATNQPPEGSH